MYLKREEREIIFLVDSSSDTVAARKLLQEREISFAEVNDSTIGIPAPVYRRPTLLVRGTAFQGLRQIKEAINTNRYLLV